MDVARPGDSCRVELRDGHRDLRVAVTAPAEAEKSVMLLRMDNQPVAANLHDEMLDRPLRSARGNARRDAGAHLDVIWARHFDLVEIADLVIARSGRSFFAARVSAARGARRRNHGGRRQSLAHLVPPCDAVLCWQYTSACALGKRKKGRPPKDALSCCSAEPLTRALSLYDG